MERKLFRKTSLDRISSPEQLNDYIHVTNPGVWMFLCAVILLLAGICVWGIFGRLETLLSVGVVTEDGQSVCYVKEEDVQMLEPDMPVRIGENQYHILSISDQPIPVDDSFARYLLHVGGLTEGEWVYAVTLNEAYGESGTIHTAQILVESLAPMSFVLN